MEGKEPKRLSMVYSRGHDMKKPFKGRAFFLLQFMLLLYLSIYLSINRYFLNLTFNLLPTF